MSFRVASRHAGTYCALCCVVFLSCCKCVVWRCRYGMVCGVVLYRSEVCDAMLCYVMLFSAMSRHVIHVIIFYFMT